MNKYTSIFIVALLTGCNNDEVNPSPTPAVEQRHDFTSIAPLYMSPYTVTETEYKVMLTVDLIRGNMSCQGECDLPLTGYDSTMFNIATKNVLINP